jgi:hypothetical protein
MDTMCITAILSGSYPFSTKWPRMTSGTAMILPVQAKRWWQFIQCAVATDARPVSFRTDPA